MEDHIPVIVSTTSDVVCVLGMGRSGTSMVSRVLSLLGYDLGPEEHIMPANHNNQAGYWEHLGLVAINEQILGRLLSTWDEPPSEPIDPGAQELSDLYSMAKQVIEADFGDKKSWAWKDPRTSLILPFWQQIIPVMRYVICMRNPLEVAASLAARDNMPLTKSLDLWFTYTARSIQWTSGQERLFVFYEDWLSDLDGEMNRLGNFVDKCADDAELYERAAMFVNQELKHHDATLVDLLEATEVPAAVKSLYCFLRLLRGSSDTNLGSGLEEALTAFASRIRDDEIAARRSLVESGARVAQAEAELVRVSAEMGSELQQISSRLEGQVQKLSVDLNAIRSRLGFQALEGVRHLADWVAPQGSFRGRILALSVRGSAYLLNLGPRAFLLRLFQPWRWLPRAFEQEAAWRSIRDMEEEVY